MKKTLFCVLVFVCCAFACSDNSNKNSTDGDLSDSDVSGANESDATDAEASDNEEQPWNGFTVVNIDENDSPQLQLAVASCAGLSNRKLGGSIYIQKSDKDKQWLEELEFTPNNTVNSKDFIGTCVSEFKSCVRYSYKDQQRLLPSILTIASSLDAIPLDKEQTADCDVVFDATTKLKDNTPYDATKYVFEKHLKQTTGLAMLNPGYNRHDSNLANPELISDMSPDMVGYVFSQKLFALFLVNGCEQGDKERELLHNIVNTSDWQKPVGVYGYNNSWMVFGGYLHEAQTKCLESRNMGAIPTMTINLSFFSTRRKPIENSSELKHNEKEKVEYDPGKTYMAFVIGDGDNINFIMSTRNVWLNQRLKDCARTENSCEPISWSISPHLVYIAPDVLKWYYKSTSQTGKDYFILPPSGHLYAYPSSLKGENQERFVSATEDDARILGLSSTVHWDFDGTWKDAENVFLPKYAKPDGAIKGIFPVNVPYMFPAFPLWPAEQFYRVLSGKDGGKVVVFRPREWRGINNDADPFFVSPKKMAEEIASYPKGTISWVYMTSDGGLNLENSFMEMVKLLPDHVKLVSADTAAKLALGAGNK